MYQMFFVQANSGGAYMKATSTSLAVAGLGAAVSTLGASVLRKNRFGAGVLGFGLAHIVLGLLDLARPTVRRSS